MLGDDAFTFHIHQCNVNRFVGVAFVKSDAIRHSLDLAIPHDFRALPNPTNSAVSVDLTNYENQATEIYLHNYLGQVSQVIKSENVTNTIVEFDVTHEPVGQYSIRVTSKGKRDVAKPVVITH